MNKKPFARFNNIFIRVYGSFAVLILLFAMILGIIFVRLYSSSNKEYNKNNIVRIAQSAAERFRGYMIDEDYLECMSYLETFNELETTEIWSVSNPNVSRPMSKRFETINIEEIPVQDEYHELLDLAFQGKSEVKTFYSEMHGATAMAASVPLVGENQEVCGAVLLIMTMEQMDEMIDSVKSMIILSAGVALVISVALALAFARRITEPVRQMKLMTQEMAEGNYKVKTGIDRTDEIGDMARSIDMLSDKLLENEKERQAMEQTRLDFFANVSHELRTPIAVVRAYMESLVDGVVTEEEQVGKYYERILRECKSMERLVADLLTLSKMQNPNFQIEKEPVNLVHIFDELVRSALAIANEKNISIVMKRDKDVCMMMGDYDRLRQMFMVIFDNAIKFSPENSSIYVTISSGSDLCVSIRDEGVGISAEELPSIFEKFYKSKLRQNAKGTGLGLAIAKYIALKHDGHIDVTSEPGKGTEFIFHFHEVFEDDEEMADYRN